MSKEIEQLSKDLAQGMSRRKALWRFALGAGAVGGLGFLTAKKANAQGGFFYCLYCAERNYGACLQDSAREGNNEDCLAEAECAYTYCLETGSCPDPEDTNTCDPIDKKT